MNSFIFLALAVASATTESSNSMPNTQLQSHQPAIDLRTKAKQPAAPALMGKLEGNKSSLLADPKQVEHAFYRVLVSRFTIMVQDVYRE